MDFSRKEVDYKKIDSLKTTIIEMDKSIKKVHSTNDLGIRR